MYDISKLVTINKEYVLTQIFEYEIYCKYLHYKPTVNKLYTSPFRQDSRPSFGLFYSRFGKLMFKDFGNGESGDCFKFVSLVEGISIRDVPKYIMKSVDITKERKQIEIPILKRKKEIAVNVIPFTQEAIKYWSNYGITEATLNLFNVSEVSRFWIDNKLRGWRTSHNLIFAYSIFDKYKIYKPFDRENRFFTNCNNADLQGWEQLDYTKDTVIITKSLKDVMLLHELGYTAISPGGEGHSIPKKALEILRQNFKYIVIMYDKDLPGLNNARKLIKANPDFGFMFTTSRYVKDISDYYRIHGIDDTFKLLSKKLEYVKSKQLKQEDKL